MKRALTKEQDQNLRYSNYKGYDEGKYYAFKVYGLIRRFNNKHKFNRSLEVGCVDGSFSKKLKNELGFEVYGVDISENAIKLARKNGLNAKVHDLEKALPYPAGYFDVVFACEVIEHMYDTDFFLSELERVLKEEGILILTTPNLASLVNRVRLLFGKYPLFVPEYKVGGAGHIRAYTVSVLKKQLEFHGLKVLVKVSPNIVFPMASKRIPGFFKAAAFKLGDFFPTFGSHMILVSRKQPVTLSGMFK